MGAFVLRRLGSLLVVMLTTSILTFLIFFATPGSDPASRMAGRNPSPQTIAAIRADYDLDKPLPVQYAVMMKKLFITGDLVSYSNRGQKVLPQLLEAAPVTLSLVTGAAVLWVLFGVGMGVAAAVMRGTAVDPLLMALGLIGVSAPVFWVGEVVNLITQSRLHDSLFSWVPALGYTPLTQDPVLWFKHLIFPWLTLSLLYIGLYGRVLRSSIIEVESEDYVRTARAKGISERRVLVRHVLRNSMVTFVSLFGLDFSALVAGSALLTEVVFGLPGIGHLTYQSLANLDLPVIIATVVYAAFFIVVINALVDIVHALMDPRTRTA